MRRWRGGQHPSGAPTAAPVDAASVEQALQRARRCRLDGRFYEFYNELAHAAAALPGRELAATLEQRAQHVGYTGERPTDDRMDGDLRAVERALARRKEKGEP